MLATHTLKEEASDFAESLHHAAKTATNKKGIIQRRVRSTRYMGHLALSPDYTTETSGFSEFAGLTRGAERLEPGARLCYLRAVAFRQLRCKRHCAEDNPLMVDSARPQPSVAYRWTVLIIISLAMGGNYYIYDSINALEQIFKDQLGFSSSSFAWLNKSYSLAALATLLIGGIVIDRVGTKKAISIFGAICLAGAILTSAQGNVTSMVAGRAVLGLGAESMIVAVTAALAKWFKGKELSFAFGINLTIARLASVAADNSPTWANRAFYPYGPTGTPSWQNPLLIAVGAGIFAVVCSLIYWALESRAEQRYELGKAGATDKLEFKEMFRFNLSYWYIVGLCFTFYSAIFPFRTFAIDLMSN